MPLFQTHVRQRNQMDTTGTRILICVLGILFAVSLIQTEAIGKKPMYRTKWSQPDHTVTIVLRAPRREPPALIISAAEGEKNIKGLAVSLPKYTPVFFSVDQVNTVLYSVKITLEQPETGQVVKPVQAFSLNKALALIEQAKKECPEAPAKTAFKAVAAKVKAVDTLNKALDTLLHQTEMPQFYIPVEKVNAGFAKIVTDARALTKETLGLPRGTAQEIRDDAVATLQKIHNVCKEKKKEIMSYIPEDLSNRSNPIVAVFIRTAEKLRAIETATWSKADTETRMLKNELNYVCVLTPNGQDAKLKPITLKVKVTPTIGLSGIRFTGGPFMTDLRDDHYIARDDKIALGGQDRFAMPLGGLAHAILGGKDFNRFSSAVALSTGFALGTGAKDGAFLVNGQAVLGISLLFSGSGGEGDMFAVTIGGIAKPVKRLNGYWIGDAFPKGSDQPTRAVYRGGGFIALTANFAFLPEIFGLKKATADKK